jgi:hypothetical protein
MNTPSKVFEANESEAIKGSIGPLVAVHATFGNTPSSGLRPQTHPDPLVQILEPADHVTGSESGRELARLQETSGLGPDQAIVVACSSTPARDPQMACRATPSPAPPHQSGHEVLPHPASRRPSLAACAVLPKLTVPTRRSSPRLFPEPMISFSPCPRPRRPCRLESSNAIRSTT